MIKRTVFLVWVALVAVLTFIAPVSPASATGGVAPDLFANSANCYQNVVESGDIYCLLQYELPTHTSASPATPEEWCLELVDQDGCIADPVEPTNETSLINNAAYVALYQNYTGTPSLATLEAQTRVPRINNSIAGAYLAGGHSVTWGDPTVFMCVESSTTLYTTPTSDCITVGWNASATDTATQRQALGTTLLAELRTLEALRAQALNSYVTNNKITTAGRTLSIEALAIMDQIIPDFFQAASQSSNTTAFATPSADVALQVSIDATAAATDIPAAFDDLGDTVGGISGGAMATVFFGGFALLFFYWVYTRTGEYVLPAAGFISVAMVGVWVRAPSVSVVAVAAVVMSLIAGMFVLRKMAS